MGAGSKSDCQRYKDTEISRPTKSLTLIPKVIDLENIIIWERNTLLKEWATVWKIMLKGHNAES